MPPQGAKANYPLPEVIPKPAPLGLVFYSIESGIMFLVIKGKWKPYKKEHGLTIWREYF